MGLYSGRLIIESIFASEISGGLLSGGAYYRNFTVFSYNSHYQTHFRLISFGIRYYHKSILLYLLFEQ